MPATTTRRREPRRVRSARRRAAHYAAEARAARDGAERLKIAERAMLSAVAHAKQRVGNREARRVADDLVAHVRDAVARAELPTSSAALYEAKLTSPRADRQRLGAALMCLRGVIAVFDPADREQAFEHYAHYLTREARAIEAKGGQR